jgi:hypothetical protein
MATSNLIAAVGFCVLAIVQGILNGTFELFGFLGVKNYIVAIVSSFVLGVLVSNISFVRISLVIAVATIVLITIGWFEVQFGDRALYFIGYSKSFGGVERFFVSTFGAANRVTGTVGDALNYGYLLSTFGLYFLAMTKHFGRRTQLLLYILWAGCGYAVINSYTRGAILGYIGGSSLIILSRSNGSSIFGCSAGIVVILFSMGDQIAEIIVDRFLDANDQSYLSTLGRVNMLLDTLRILSDAWTGIGFGSQTLGDLNSTYDFRVNTDNCIAAIFLECGVFIGSLFISIILSQTLSGTSKYRFGSVLCVETVAVGINVVFATLFSNHSLAPIGFVPFLIVFYAIVVANSRYPTCEIGR